MRMGFSILQFIFRGMKGGSRTMSTSSIGKISSPWLMLPSSSFSEALYSKFYSLPETKVVSIKKEAPPPPWAAQGEVEHLGCSHGWVASYNKDNRQTFLSDPFTGRHIKLPDVHTLYSPSSKHCPVKIILSSPPTAHDCRAILTYGSIPVCFPAHSCTTWLPVCGQRPYRSTKWLPVYSTHHNRLFCIVDDYDVQCWDLESPSFVWQAELNLDEESKGCDYNKYLMTDEHSGRLFLVVRKVVKQVGRDGSSRKFIRLKCGHYDYGSYPHKTTSFKVYEIDAKDGKIRYMDASLDGFAMFVGSNHSLVLPAADLNLRPDSIYFTDDLTHDIYEDGGNNHDIGIFDYVDRKLSSIYYPSHVSQISHTLAPTMWFTPIPH